MTTSLTQAIVAPVTITPETFGKVAVVLGGNSAERDVSLASGQAILTALNDYGIDAHAFDPKYRCLCELVDEKFDRVFIALHGRGGEDGSIQGALALLGLPYTGSGVTGSALSIDKVLSKLIWHARKLPTADYIVVSKSDFKAAGASQIMLTLGNQVMVKPALEGSSLGMAKATNEQELLSAIKTAFEYDSQVLIEAFITGPEYTVSILGTEALPSITMKSASGFYDYYAKYQANTTEYHCPSGLSDADESYVQSLALDAFNALQGKGWGRVDLMRDSATDSQGKPCGKFYLLESNTVPGMTKTSLVPKAAKQAGLSFEQLVVHILAQTLAQNLLNLTGSPTESSGD
ncbi:MAG: D-alanine-D-alanine ligase [Alphaproteobacteria bacterium]|jgi:D-alanine-D-alanine ligase